MSMIREGAFLAKKLSRTTDEALPITACAELNSGCGGVGITVFQVERPITFLINEIGRMTL